MKYKVKYFEPESTFYIVDENNTFIKRHIQSKSEAEFINSLLNDTNIYKKVKKVIKDVNNSEAIYDDYSVDYYCPFCFNRGEAMHLINHEKNCTYALSKKLIKIK